MSTLAMIALGYQPQISGAAIVSNLAATWPTPPAPTGLANSATR